MKLKEREFDVLMFEANRYTREVKGRAKNIVRLRCKRRLKTWLRKVSAGEDVSIEN